MKPSMDELQKRDLLDMARRCAREAHATLEEMLSEDRTSAPTRARALFYAALAADHWSNSAIARLVGRHPSTVQKTLDSLTKGAA